MDDTVTTAVQGVVDRLTSYQATAQDSDVESELRNGLDEVGVQLDDEQVARLVHAIDSREHTVDVAALIDQGFTS